MRHRALMFFLSFMAALLWLGLVAFMHRRPPDSVNQAIFLVIWGAAIACTVTPLSFALNKRLNPLSGKAQELTRAIRQGLLVGILAMTLMALRFLRLLNLLTAVLLTLIVLMVEILAYLRSR